MPQQTPATATPGSTPTMARQLADHVHDLRFADIPRNAIDQAKDHLVHHFGLAFACHFIEPGRQALRLAQILSPQGTGCTVIGSRVRAAQIDAAFANTTLMRETGLDDVLFPVAVHAGLVTMPIALALGEERRLPGAEVLTAIIAGYDVMGKLGRPVWAWNAATPRRPTIAFGPFGSAAVAARLLGLDRHQTAHAMGYAAHSAMGLAVGNLVTHYYSLVSRNGYMAALLAREGGEASPAALEGRFGFFDTFFGGLPNGLDESLGTLGETYEIRNATTKHYPGTALNIVAIQLMMDLVRRHGLTSATVSRIVVALPVERENFINGHGAPPFENSADASSSVRFQLAIVLLDGTPRAEHFERFGDPEILEIVDRIEVRLVTGRQIRYARVQVTTADGRELSAEGEDHRFPRAEWSSWLARYGARLLPLDKLNRLVDLLGRFEELDDVSEVMACTIPEPTGRAGARDANPRDATADFGR
jgi:2-methylcitrate dehydratase PrpD